jgi:hypothetical protein
MLLNATPSAKRVGKDKIRKLAMLGSLDRCRRHCLGQRAHAL